jgi:hypothetical protein
VVHFEVTCFFLITNPGFMHVISIRLYPVLVFIFTQLKECFTGVVGEEKLFVQFREIVCELPLQLINL